jgi:hypothetical protein
VILDVRRSTDRPMDFRLEDTLRGSSDEDALADLRRCADQLGRDTLTMAEYEQYGKAHPSMFQRRFGSWPKALEAAGLKPSRSRIGISNEELFENLRALWMELGRQPRYCDVQKPASNFSVGTYEKRFGGFRKSLDRFVEWVNAGADLTGKPDKGVPESPQAKTPKRRTRRGISEKQRFRVLMRGGFRCLACGQSHLKEAGVELHVDHVIPWSKGGETVDENLQSKCSRCNLGKGNAFDA